MRYLIFLLFSLIFFLTVISCETISQKEERLAKQYCGSCHLFPEPNLLDKETWANKVLPQMAFRMGFINSEIINKIPPNDLPIVLEIIPKEPIISIQEWEAICNYFNKNAPDSLTVEERSITDSVDQFNIYPSRLFRKSFITLLKFDSINRKMYAGNRASKLYELNSDFSAVDSIQLSSPPSHIDFDDDDFVISEMGIMDPNDQAKGKLVSIKRNSKTASVILDSLQRPVYFEKKDFNNDGQDDFVVCAFGNYTGGLLLFESKGHNKFERHSLNSMPGARKVTIRDLNGDGLKDILALMTQGDERLILYINKGNLTFEEKVLLRFPPVYGSNYFEIADFNKDGYFDILLANGDNGDYSIILKPYHAIRIFENDGKNNFHQSWSYRMHGASQAAAVDFDKDGDLDIAAIAFFPDFKKHPQESFIYFENTGNYNFVPQTTDMGASGRWLVMETADYDSDGDTDIILGAANFRGLGANNAKTSWSKNQASLLIFKNNMSENKRNP